MKKANTHLEPTKTRNGILNNLKLSLPLINNISSCSRAATISLYASSSITPVQCYSAKYEKAV